MAGGRPSKYKGSKTIEVAKEYIGDSGLIHHKHIISQSKTSVTFKNTWTPKLPTMCGLAKRLGVARSTLYYWAEIHKDFDEIMKYLVDTQEDILIRGGLSRMLNANIVIFILMGRARWRPGGDPDYC